MDAHQVNSRAIHDEPDPELDDYERSINGNGAGDVGEKSDGMARDEKQPQQQLNDDLERQQTMRSTASYQETYPEGGLQAWLVVAGSWFAMIASMGLMNSIAVFQAYTLSHQLKNYSEGTVGWIFSIYTWLAFFGGVYIGPVFDKYGPRWLVVAGCACTVGALISMSFCTGKSLVLPDTDVMMRRQLYQFILSFGVLGGLGTSLTFTPCIAAVGHWFKARRGFATGLASTAGGIGGIVFPLMLTALFARIGYGWATRVLALICLVCGLVGISLVRSRLPPAKNATAHPDFRIFRQIPFLLTTIGIFLIEFSLFIPLTYISTYAQHQGFGDTFAYHLLPIMNAGSVIGRALPGYYADVVGAFNVCVFSVVFSFISCLCVWLPLGHTKAGIIIFSLLFGFGSGNSIAIAPVCIGRMCKTQEYGRYYATTYTIVSFACLIGIPIAGSIVQAAGGSYTNLIIFTSCIYIGAAFFLVLAKTWQLGWKNWLAAY
ncbi:mfs monocarboxylate transporter [Trichoderma arundinaceum]|uniref:Mfs monocarboxylate transporter n=1 Tax=Trichoderma arundinaceum TaxID=490622 RepID=A0A395NCQ8_TRIAR|nr:mfs monocarboxylate transporter [Trichoderma arundinaceum]